MQKTISFVIPVFNSGPFLIEAVNSILGQNSADIILEILIVDDYSTDPETLKIISSMGDIQNVRVIRQPVNGGPANNYGGNVASLSSRYLEDGSFVRLKTLSLGYNLPASLLQKIKISKIRLYAQATNLLTFTRYGGLDPEVSSQSSNQNTAGYDWATIPQPKTFQIGANVTF